MMERLSEQNQHVTWWASALARIGRLTPSSTFEPWMDDYQEGHSHTMAAYLRGFSNGLLTYRAANRRIYRAALFVECRQKKEL